MSRNSPKTRTDTPTPDAKPQRDASGRFVKGNGGGPGNPFARKCAALRTALINAVSAEDIKDLAILLLFQAKSGDLAAMKLLFAYVMGRPPEAPDPDRLDVDEWRLAQESAVPVDDLKRLFPACNVDFARQVMPIVVEAQTKMMGGQLLNGFAALDEADRRRAEALASGAPSPNEPSGAAPDPKRTPTKAKDRLSGGTRRLPKSRKTSEVSAGGAPAANDDTDWGEFSRHFSPDDPDPDLRELVLEELEARRPPSPIGANGRGKARRSRGAD